MDPSSNGPSEGIFITAVQCIYAALNVHYIVYSKSKFVYIQGVMVFLLNRDNGIFKAKKPCAKKSFKYGITFVKVPSEG